MKKQIIFTLLVSVTLMFCICITPSVTAASDEEEVLQVASNFVNAFNNCDLGLMSSLYWHSSKTSEFHPTTGYPFLFQGWEVIEKNWKSTFEFPIGTIIVAFHNLQVVMLDTNVAIVTGYTNAIVNPPAVKEQSISQIRTTFVVQKIDRKWLIVHHHSSNFPTE